jgi:hypothetical protein
MTAMQKWLADHRLDARGMSAGAISSFEQWLQEREAIAKQAPA